VLGVAVLGTAVLGVAVLGTAVLGVAVLGTAVLGVAVVGTAVLHRTEAQPTDRVAAARKLRFRISSVHMDAPFLSKYSHYWVT